MLYGYCRVSTTDQDLAIQEAALRAAGCEIIRGEKRSGTSLEARDELQTLLAFLRPGDVLMCTRIDRIARSISDLQDIIKALRGKSASLRCTEQPIDMTTASGKAFLDMLGVFAEFETSLRRERQLEGIARAKAKGVYAGKGRPRQVDARRIRELAAEGSRVHEIAKALSCSRASIYRAVAGEDGPK